MLAFHKLSPAGALIPKNCKLVLGVSCFVLERVHLLALDGFGMSTFVLQLVLALCLLSGHAWARAPSASNAQYYDKQVNVFNSEGDLPQLAYADIAASRGESLVCLCTDDGGVVLCTPTWSGAPLLDRRVIDKIAKVDDGGIWVAFAGLAGDGRSLVRIARRICASHRLQFNAPPTLRYLTKSIADIQHDATLSGSERPFGANLIVMGYDQGAETPQVLLSRASGSISQWRAAAIGKNAVKALAHLEAKLVASTAEKLVRRPATAIEAAAMALDLFRQHGMSLCPYSTAQCACSNDHIPPTLQTCPHHSPLGLKTKTKTRKTSKSPPRRIQINSLFESATCTD